MRDSHAADRRARRRAAGSDGGRGDDGLRARADAAPCTHACSREGAVDAGHVDTGTTGTGEGIDDGGAGVDIALPATDLGDIVLTSGTYQSGAKQELEATGVFYPSVTQTGCTVVGIDGCTLERCVDSYPTIVGAGSIAVAGGLYPLLLTPGAVGVYGPEADDGGALTLWHGGETLVVSGSGGAVPPFTGSVVAPMQVTVLTPMPGLVARGEGFGVQWFQASPGRVAVDFTTVVENGHDYLDCQFDVATAYGTVPPDALSALPPGAATR